MYIGVFVCAALVGMYFTQKWNLVFVISTCILILCIIIVHRLPLPLKLFFKYTYKEFSKFPVFKFGSMCMVYTYDDKLWKVLASNVCTNGKCQDFPIGKKYHGEYYCTLNSIMARQLKLKIVWISWTRLLRLQNEGDDICKFFPRIYTIDHERRAILVERIEHDLIEERCPADYQKQISELDGHLRRVGLFVDDLHIDNVMIDDSGLIKIVDSELYTLDEMQYIRSLNSVTSSNNSPTSYVNTTNIFTSMWSPSDLNNANKVCL